MATLSPMAKAALVWNLYDTDVAVEVVASARVSVFTNNAGTMISFDDMIDDVTMSLPDATEKAIVRDARLAAWGRALVVIPLAIDTVH